MLKEPIIRKIFGKVEINTIIRKLEGRKLKQTEKNYLYRSIRPKLAAAEIISQSGILKRINKRSRRNDRVINYNLAAYGYSMIAPSKSKKERKLPIEELIADIIIKNPGIRYIEAVPVLIVKNKVDVFKMLEIASKHGIKNKLGYLIETAMMFKKMPYLEGLLSYLRYSKDKETAFLAEGDYGFLSETSPERVRKWNLLGRFFDSDFKRNAEAYL